VTPDTPQDPQQEPTAPGEEQAPSQPTAEEPKASRKPRKRKAAKAEPAAEQTAAEAKKPAKKRAARKAPAKAAAAEPVAEKPAEPAAEAKQEPAAAARPAPARPKRARRKVVRAHARYVRTSARKARMVCGHLRGKSVQEARAILAFTPREVARDWSKLLESAVANAESNHELLEDDLVIREAYADEGPTIKRFRPRAMGRATPIRKRTSHLTITLTPGPERPTTKKR
jgi:ribosomal protein L22